MSSEGRIDRTLAGPDAVPRYRGRLAPSPTGFLHLGHARTFWAAQQRARLQNGILALRNEDLDPARSRSEFLGAILEDLHWFGLEWQEGPDRGGPFAPYSQSERRSFYLAAIERLHAGGFIYPCTCSRRDVVRAAQAPHAGEEEPLYPGTCRPAPGTRSAGEPGSHRHTFAGRNWRFRVPDGEVLEFLDRRSGVHRFVAGKDFGDFVVWRHDDIPAYQLAVVVDDAAMRITEVVRGEDLLRSTARQLLLYRALNLPTPAFYHCELVTDEAGVRLAKRHAALSLRVLRSTGARPEQLRANW